METEGNQRNKSKHKVTFKLFMKEPDPEVQAWLRSVSESDYDLVSTAYKELRYSGGTKAKMLLHKAMQSYADQERNKAIDECIRLFDCNEYYYGDIVQNMLESLKVKPQ